MNETNDGGPVFPQERISYDRDLLKAAMEEANPRVAIHAINAAKQITHQSGLSIRDWFAGMALQGIIVRFGIGDPSLNYCAAAYEQADAMIKERSK